MPINSRSVTALLFMLRRYRPVADLKAKSLPLALAYGWVGSTYGPLMGNALPGVDFFLPALVIALYRLSTPRFLWVAWLCGLWMDLLSPHRLFGLYALANAAAASLCLPCRRYFFPEQKIAALAVSSVFGVAAQLLVGALLWMQGAGGGLGPLAFLSAAITATLYDTALALAYLSLPSLLLGDVRGAGAAAADAA